jgi:hypothetical protein
MPLRILIVTGMSCRAPLLDGCADDGAEEVALPGQGRSPALAGHLGHRAAEVEVDVVGAVLGGDDPRREPGGRRVDAVELDAARVLVAVVLEQPHGLRGALDDGPRGDHLVDVEARGPARTTGRVARGPVTAAQPPEGEVGDARHRREHHGRLDDVPPDVQRREDGSDRHGATSVTEGARTAQNAGQIEPGTVLEAEPERAHAGVGSAPSRVDRVSPADGVRATWLGHASVLLDLGGVRLLTDPLLRPRLGPLRRRHDLPVHRHVDDVDAVLLSHLHHDHADLPSLRRLGDIPVVTERSNVPWLDKNRLGIGGCRQR